MQDVVIEIRARRRWMVGLAAPLIHLWGKLCAAEWRMRARQTFGPWERF